MASKMGKHVKNGIMCAPVCTPGKGAKAPDPARATGEVKEMVDAMTKCGVIIIQNTCFYKGKTNIDLDLAENMASLAVVFVNDAFDTAHSAHSLAEAVIKYLDLLVTGFPLKKELDYLTGAVDRPSKAIAADAGGAKVSIQISVIESMLGKVSRLAIGGSMFSRS